MPSHDPKHHVVRTVRAGVIAVSFVALTAVLGGDTAGGGDVTGSGAPQPGAITGQEGTEDSDISSAFETLSRPQQARVMQRCKDLVARPALVDPNQLTICQMLLAMARR